MAVKIEDVKGPLVVCFYSIPRGIEREKPNPLWTLNEDGALFVFHETEDERGNKCFWAIEASWDSERRLWSLDDWWDTPRYIWFETLDGRGVSPDGSEVGIEARPDIVPELQAIEEKRDKERAERNKKYTREQVLGQLGKHPLQELENYDRFGCTSPPCVLLGMSQSEYEGEIEKRYEGLSSAEKNVLSSVWQEG